MNLASRSPDASGNPTPVDDVVVRFIAACRIFVPAVGVVALIRTASLLDPVTVDWDENTFLLVAQRMAMGELPFTTTFDNKPPALAALQAVPLLLAPTSLVGVRFALVLVIAVTAMALRAALIGSGVPKRIGDLVVPLTAVLSMASAGGIPWMSQHSANMWLALLVMVVIQPNPRDRTLVLAGVLASVLVLTRTNYAFPASGLILLSIVWMPATRRVRGSGLVLLGGIIPLGIMVLLYARDGQVAALRAGVLDVVLGPGGQADIRDGIGVPPTWLVWLCLAFALLHITGRSRRFRGAHADPKAMDDRIMTANLTMAFGLAVSVLLHASIFGHYRQMFTVPLALSALVSAAGLLPGDGPGRDGEGRVIEWRPIWIRTSALAVSGALLLLGGFTLSHLIPDRSSSRPDFEAGLVAALDELVAANPGSVWALNHHFVYWRTLTLPPHPLVTHPSSLAKPEFWASVPEVDGPSPGSAADAVSLVLRREPRYIVGSEDLGEWYLLDLGEDAQELLREEIELWYQIVYRSPSRGAVIWARES